MLLMGLEDKTAEVLNESLEVIKTEDPVLKEDLKEGSNILTEVFITCICVLEGLNVHSCAVCTAF